MSPVTFRPDVVRQPEYQYADLEDQVVPPETLGYRAVNGLDMAAYILTRVPKIEATSNYNPTSNTDTIQEPSASEDLNLISQMYTNKAMEQIEAIHRELVTSPEGQLPTLNLAIGKVLRQSPYLREQYADWMEVNDPLRSLSYLRWLLGEQSANTGKNDYRTSIDPNEYVVDPSRLLMFMQLNRHILKREQIVSDALKSVEIYKNQWGETAKDLVAKGIMDSTTLDRLPRLSDIQAYIGDDFIFAKNLGMHGYHARGSKMIVLSQVGAGLHGEAITHHELGHAVGWGGDVEDLLQGRFSSFDNIWVDEALTEHLTQTGLGNSKVEVVNIDQGGYPDFRELLWALVSEAQKRGSNITMKDLTLTYSTSGEHRSTRIAQVDQELSRVFQHEGDVFSAIGDSMIRYADDLGEGWNLMVRLQLGARAILSGHWPSGIKR